MSNIDNNAIMSIGYGLYVLTASYGGKDNGCIINVVAQLTSSPMRMMALLSMLLMIIYFLFRLQ